MVVYADLIFLLNGCIDFLLLWLTSAIRRQPTSIWRMLLAAVFGASYSALYLWSTFDVAFLFPIKILISIMMIFISFGFNHPLSFMRNLFVFYLVCFLTGGAMVAMHYLLIGDNNVLSGSLFTTFGGWGSPVSWLFVVLGFPLVWLYTKFSFQSLEERQISNQYITHVHIHIGNHLIECTGLIDTGNQLRDPISRAPVIMVELTRIESCLPEELKKAVLEGQCVLGDDLSLDWLKRIRVIPYRAAGSKGDVMFAIKPDKVLIQRENEWHMVDKVLIGIDVGLVSSDGSFQAIIHPSCLSVSHNLV